MIHDPRYRPYRPHASPQRAPVLVIAAGPLATSVEDDMIGVANDLGVRVDGRFGFANVYCEPDEPAENMPPEPSDEAGNDDAVADDEKARFTCQTHILDYLGGEASQENATTTREVESGLATLIRSLRPARDFADTRGSWHPRLEVYLLIDLRELPHVRCGLRAVEVVLKETLRVDITAILLSGRCVEEENQSDNRWKEGLREIAQANDVGMGSLRGLLHRAYLIDGVNSREGWMQDLDEFGRMAAEFVFHHGFSPYRYSLRRNERSRILKNQRFGEILGSAACRTVPSNPEALAPAIADALLEQDLFSDADRALSASEQLELRRIADKLESELYQIFKEAAQPGDIPNSARAAGAAAAAVNTALSRVCQDRALRRASAFVVELKNLLERVRIKANVIERTNERERVSSELKSQLIRSPVLTPAEFAEKWAVLARPPKEWRYWMGLLIAAGTFICCLSSAAWTFWPLLIGVPLIFLGVLYWDMPENFSVRKWSEGRWEGDYTFRISVPTVLTHRIASVPHTQYRRRRSVWREVVGTVMAVLGGVGVAYVCEFPAAVGWPEWTEIAIVASLAGIAGLIGLVCDSPGKYGRRLEDAAGRHVTVETDYPLSYFPWTLGLLRCIAFLVLTILLYFVVLRWQIQFRAANDIGWPLPIPAEFAPWYAATCLFLTGAGLALAFYPSIERKQFYDSDPSKPQVPDLEDILGNLRVREQVDTALRDMWNWLEEYLREKPKKSVDRDCPIEWNKSGDRVTFLDVIADEWPRKLAGLCHGHVERSVSIPHYWSSCILTSYHNRSFEQPPEQRLRDLSHHFATRVVQEWLTATVAEHEWAGVMRVLAPKPHWLGRYFQTSLAPQWPIADRYVEIDEGIALVDSRLQLAAAAQSINTDSRWRVRGVNWECAQEPGPGQVVLIRMVQDLPDAFLADLLLESEANNE